MLIESLLKATLLNSLPTSFSQFFWSIIERDVRINELELGRKRVILSDSRSFFVVLPSLLLISGRANGSALPKD